MHANVALEPIPTRQPPLGTLIVFDRCYRLVGVHGVDSTGWQPLRSQIESGIRALTAHWNANPASQNESSFLVSAKLAVHVFPLRGANGYRIGAHVEAYRRRATPLERADQLGLRPSEYECVRLFASGLQIDEIAWQLGLDEPAVATIFEELQRRFDVSTVMAMVAIVAGAPRRESNKQNASNGPRSIDLR